MIHSATARWAAALMCAAALAVAAPQARQKSAPPRAPAARSGAASAPAALQTARNLGKAHYEQRNYAESVKRFQAVVASGRALPTDYLDLGMAQMQIGKYDAALGSLTTARQMDPKLIAADYNLGILFKRELRYPDAEAALQRVVHADPADPAAWFNLGAVQVNQQKFEQALQSYRRVLDMGFARGQNFYVVSLFHTFNALVRLRRQQEAQKYLALHQQYRDRVPAISVEPVALEAGKYGAVLVPNAVAPTPARESVPVKFADATAGLGLADLRSAGAGALVVGDYDADGKPDLFIASPSGDRLLHNANGRLQDVSKDAGIDGASTAAIVADFDNSGHPSLLTGGSGGLKLYRSAGTAFTDATASAKLDAARAGITCLVAFDADNDGLLDFFAGTAGDSAGFLFRNNGDKTFSDVTREAGLASAGGPVRQALFADLNADGFFDLLLLRDAAPPLLLFNQGMARFTAGRASLPEASAAHIADFDHDGAFDLVLWTGAGPAVFRNRGDASFTRVPLPPLQSAAPGLVADLDGNGFDDLLLYAGDRAWHALANRGGVFRDQPVALPGAQPRQLAPAWFTDPSDLDLLALLDDGSLALWRRASPGSRWLEVRLKGQKSNLRGVGTTVEIKAGNFYQKILSTGEPLRVFIGDLAKVDVIRVTWPNAIVQNEIGVAAGKIVEVRESERVASSCPLLYAWNGTRYEYLTDVLGVAPLGELSLRVPTSREYVRLPAWVAPRDRQYTFQLTDEMREVDYVDGARLLAVDHAPGEQIYANEIYTAAQSEPELYRVRNRHAPVAAGDDAGADLLALVRGRDQQYVGGFRPTRILGIAETHALTLDLGQAARAPRLALWLTGWVLWPDSNSAQALRSQTRQIVGPYLQVRDGGGKWVTVIDDIGLPSGTDRSMRVDLTGKFPAESREVRIVTNLRVYWDEIFLTTDEEPVAPASVVAPRAADLHYRGFSTVAGDPEGIRPDRLHYTRLDLEAPWDPAPGRYTRYGDVRELVASADDRMVVMAPGDELTVTFPADSLPPLRPGMVRQLFLALDGWAKDNEPNTLSGNSPRPLPFRAMKQYPYPPTAAGQPGRRDYERRYLTRPARALIPPLPPVAR